MTREKLEESKWRLRMSRRREDQEEPMVRKIRRMRNMVTSE